MIRNFKGIVILSLSLLLGVTACSGIGGFNTIDGSGKLKTESRSVHGFDSISMESIGLLDIQATGTESLSVSADDNLLPYLKTAVVNHRLEFTDNAGNSTLKPSQPIHFLLTVISLKDLAVSGATNVNIGPYTTDTLTVDLSGVGAIHIVQLKANTVTAHLSGVGSLTIDGTAKSQSIDLSGTGGYNARSFLTSQATVTLDGVGNVTISVSDTLNATLDGVGSVTYYGSPTVTQHVSGVGSVKQGT